MKIEKLIDHTGIADPIPQPDTPELSPLAIAQLERNEAWIKLEQAEHHADKLAEALKAAQAWLIACSDKDYTYARQAIAIKASEALAAYEAAQP